MSIDHVLTYKRIVLKKAGFVSEIRLKKIQTKF